MLPKLLQSYLILLFAACLTLVGCSHGAPGAAGNAGGGGTGGGGSGGGGGGTSASAAATTGGGGGTGGGSGGDSGQSGGGGAVGAPITIPNIIIHQGDGVEGLKDKILERASEQNCGNGCITVITNTSAGTCLSSYNSSPPPIATGGVTNGPYIFKRGTVVTLIGGPCPSPSDTSSPPSDTSSPASDTSSPPDTPSPAPTDTSSSPAP